MTIKLTRRGAAVAFALLTSTASFAQNDECAQAIALSAGSLALDTTTATVSATPWPCAGSGGPDIWYSYLATSNSTITVSTCGSTFDTALEVFDGTCAVLNSIACNDDSCGLQSSIQFGAASGSTYLIRVGGYNGANGFGTISLDDGRPQLNPANGHYYARVASAGISWDQSRADAAAMTHMGLTGHLATLTSQQENDFVFALGGVNNLWIGGFQNTASASYAEPAGGWEWITGEPFVYANWLPGEPNNSGAFGAEDYLELLQSAGFGDTWNDAAQMEHPAGFLVEFDSDSLGTNYCMANVNSTGAIGRMSASGSLTASNNDVTLTASEIPRLSFGFFITSTVEGFVMNPGGSSGNLCLLGAIGRYVGPGQIQNSGVAGEINLPINLAQTPTPTGFVSVLAGDTRSFQLWHRDSSGGTPTSNFTDGLRLTFN
ncbi:Lectin C-type domain protein [Planctomycetes bacterium Poly30]|uniref:Lectin C-type domain protein n=1 Tax=Saltatorellus ferox TaxID=2528018 RepID=A0A518ENK2_9BACT|nr:Lectin C-type domain protein [Planctomycetes bacterium Poly30]